MPVRNYDTNMVRLARAGTFRGIPAKKVKPGMKIRREDRPICDVVGVEPYRTHIILKLRCPNGQSDRVEHLGKTLVVAYWS